MKNLFVFLLAVLALTAAPIKQADAKLFGAPFIPELDARLDSHEQIGQSASRIGVSMQPIARVVYDVSVQGGAQNGVYPLGMILPQNSLVTRSYYHVSTAFVGAGASVQVNCVQTGDLLMSPTGVALLTAGAVREGNESGSVASFIGPETAPCTLQVQVTGGTLTQGRLEFLLNYAVVK